MNISIFILSAGFGERLRPITLHIPKPLLPILGKPILQLIIEKVSKLNPNQILINLHYKKEMIEEWLRSFVSKSKTIILHEDKILGTGGALKNAEKFLEENLFVVYNSDVLSDIDLECLINHHISSKNIATLAIHDYPTFNKLEIDGKGFLKGIHETGEKGSFAFTGIAVYEKKFLRFLPEGVSSILTAWIKAINQGYKIGTFDISGTYWKDIGTPVSYFKAVIDALKKDGEMVYIDPSIDWCNNIEFEGNIIIEKGVKKISKDKIRLRNCLILPSSQLSNSNYVNCITFSKFKLDINETELLEKEGNNNYILVGRGGSDRIFFRTKGKEKSVILMQSDKNNPDFQRHIEYTIFFKKYGVPVPELIKIDTENKRAYFEDLGDITLYSWLKCKRSNSEIEEMYQKVIEILILLHTTATEHVNECPLLKNRIFDYEYFRWESNYFIERFVKAIMNIGINEFPNLDKELHKLALKADSFPKTIIHRDFQSQNIIVKDFNSPYTVDYQGARIGPPAYDIVSLMWDPYWRIDDSTRERLLDYYIHKMSKNMQKFKENEFRETILPCRLQRHMQALGAYGFLSEMKAKKYFLKYVPEGIRLLKEDAYLTKEEYPDLYRLVVIISEARNST